MLWVDLPSNLVRSRLLTGLALVAAYVVLRRLVGYPASLDNGRDLARFFLSAPVLCLASATFSLGGMAALGAIDASDLPTSWLTWWIGDTLGVLLLLPIMMIAAGKPRAL